MPNMRLPRCGRGRMSLSKSPLATTVEDAERVVAVPVETNRKLVVGYILRHHPSWQHLIAEARSLGGPMSSG